MPPGLDLGLSGLGWLIGKGADAASDLTVGPLAEKIGEAVASMLKTLGTLWIRLDTPNVWSESAGASPTVTFLHSEVAALVGLLAVLGILVGAARLAWEQRADASRDLVRGLIVLALVTGCGVPMIGLLVAGADAWSQSIVDDASGGDFGRNIAGLLQLTGPSLAPFLVIVFGMIALLVSIAQVVLLVFRAGMLVLLAGLLPVAASMTTTQTGREHFRKYCAWVLALVAYKPAAALIYAAAFRLIGTHQLNAHGVGQVLIGLSLMIAAVVALPALLRFLVPAVGALGHGGGGHAGTAAAMAMPTGARMLAGRGGGGATSTPSAKGAAPASGAAAGAGAAVPVAGVALAGAQAVKQGAAQAANHATNPNGKSA